MKGAAMRNYSASCLAIAVLASLVSADAAYSYTEPTHRYIVVSAVDFILSSATDSAPYIDGATGSSDFELFRSSFPGMDNEALRRVSEEIGQASSDTDRRTDIVLRIPGLFGSTPSSGIGGVSFTTF